MKLYLQSQSFLHLSYADLHVPSAFVVILLSKQLAILYVCVYSLCTIGYNISGIKALKNFARPLSYRLSIKSIAYIL